MTIEARFAGRLGDFALDVDLTAPSEGITAIFGRSGAGKSTLLRCIAGLERLPGRLIVQGQVWQDGRTFLPPHRRPVGYVFQEPSLLPHLSVRGNLDYGFRRATARRIGFEEAVELLGLKPLLPRSTLKLSGGERQRVAIGRALLAQPELLLMDEPLSSLDVRAKAEILPYLERLHQSLQVPVLYVSHDASEIARIADRLMLMQEGRILPAPAAGEPSPVPALPSDPDQIRGLALAALAAGLRPITPPPG